MNEAYNNILTRRSIRKYRPEQISREELDAVLEAGKFAPTGMGLQPAIMIAVQDAETVALLSRLNAKFCADPNSDPFYGAPTVIVVLCRADSRFIREDGSLVMGNLMNAAHAPGLGSCWINRAREVFDTDEGKALLKKWGVEGDYVGVGHCILGYAAEERQPKPRKDNFVYYVL